IRGEPFDERTDIYSLGVTLYELLTRRPAFLPAPGVHVLTHEPLKPRLVNRNIPRDLETIVLRAMARRAPDRYRSAAALADDLRRFLRDEPIRARPIGPVGRFVRWCRRTPALSLVTTAAAVLLMALGLFFHFRLMAERNQLKRAKSIADVQLTALLRE